MLLPFLTERLLARQVASDLVNLLARLQLFLKQALPVNPYQGEASMLFTSPPLSVESGATEAPPIKSRWRQEFMRPHLASPISSK
jgi:hypothetical protein